MQFLWLVLLLLLVCAQCERETDPGSRVNTIMYFEDVRDPEVVRTEVMQREMWTDNPVCRPGLFERLATMLRRAMTTTDDNPGLSNSAEEPRPFVVVPFLSSAASVLVVALGVAVVISVFF